MPAPKPERSDGPLLVFEFPKPPTAWLFSAGSGGWGRSPVGTVLICSSSLGQQRSRLLAALLLMHRHVVVGTTPPLTPAVRAYQLRFRPLQERIASPATAAAVASTPSLITPVVASSSTLLTPGRG